MNLFLFIQNKFSDKFHAKYIQIAFINTIFGYFLSISVFFILYEYIGIFFVGLVSHIINITFSFISYKLFLFKIKKPWLSEYIKFHIAYSIVGICGIMILWIFFEILNFNIFISLFFSLALSFILSYFANRYFVFK
jgi:putative flippase GtrA